MSKIDALKNSKTEVPFSSNGIRLSPGQWIFVAIICLAAISFTPLAWERFEKFSPGADYRQPYDLSNDYWLYQQYCQLACLEYETVIIGDSVIWGHYVSKNNTLSHYLNEISDSNQFANLGLDGIHPAAMEGLLRYYGKDIKNKNVILHFNPLWMSSPKHDLQTEKEFHFNHPKLVAQFLPRIPCYKTSFSSKISNVVKRYINFPGWISHLNINYFRNMGIPEWTLQNPYRNPLRAVTFRIPEEDVYEKTEITNRSEKKTAGNSFQWVQPETSLQWKFLKRSIRLLKERENRVFVLLGPFNENILEKESRNAYTELKSKVELWLRQNNVDYFVPSVLPAELYQDASHPQSEGYAMLAKQLFSDESFRSCILNPGKD